MTLAEQSARKRKILERAGRLPHNPEFDEAVAKERHSVLLIIALLSALVFGFAIDAYYRFKYPVTAHSGEILAKSDLTNAQIHELNVVSEKKIK